MDNFMDIHAWTIVHRSPWTIVHSSPWTIVHAWTIDCPSWTIVHMGNNGLEGYYAKKCFFVFFKFAQELLKNGEG